jgi:YbgC/YbaW family acyl-CoA thioester hydrolase
LSVVSADALDLYTPMAPFLPFSVRERVRWSDCDPLGIIFYGAYIRLFEVAEHELLRAVGLPFDVLRGDRGVWLPRKAFHAEFDSPAAMDEEVLVSAGIERIGSTSITFAFAVARASDGVSRARATLTVVCVHKESMAKYPVPDWLREALAPLRTDAGDVSLPP